MRPEHPQDRTSPFWAPPVSTGLGEDWRARSGRRRGVVLVVVLAAVVTLLVAVAAAGAVGGRAADERRTGSTARCPARWSGCEAQPGPTGRSRSNEEPTGGDQHTPSREKRGSIAGR